ncbi:cytochrome c maturation protein CcmE [Paracoccus kondratievae]|uniref:Cytochrome c-type biogenesis protein CcmE n=2 Tax=Paracoccus TaxID=265 RepID=A0AAD3RUY5_9RHOB|nr:MULTISPECIES: cytochrome c maturation protein CcmE [Paracoccus]QFQ86776.1 cytochrome c maturation protein CcmE [Paracoccus kondratievae]GLK65430.1 cytochrome c-type biogenesis protein CcmE [Paracoccus kondratievae]SMG37690.1 cytochrome c-type biogenesis protein CcmE [Paracoccus sp. J56]
MKSLKKKRRIQIIIAAAVALVLAVGLIGYGFRDGINLYRSPSQMAENPPSLGEIFRLGGLVEDGTLIRGAGETVSFRVTDGGASIPVRFTGVLPDLFAEGQGMIGTGRMEGDTFIATEILAKHDENYMPREVIDSLKEQGVYEDPNS